LKQKYYFAWENNDLNMKLKAQTMFYDNQIQFILISGKPTGEPIAMCCIY